MWPRECLKLGTGHFLPAVSTQGKKEEGKGNANECWQSLLGLPFARSSGCQTKRSYKILVPQRVQNFPGKAGQEHSHSSTSWLIGTSTSPCTGYFPKRERCAGIPCVLNPGLCSRQLLTLQNDFSEVFMHWIFDFIYFLVSWKQPQDTRALSKDTFGVYLSACEVSRTFVYSFLVFFM